MSMLRRRRLIHGLAGTAGAAALWSTRPAFGQALRPLRVGLAEGDDATLTPNPAWGVVTVDAYEPLNFTNKDSLVIDSGPGTDTIDLNNSNVPAGSTLGSHLALQILKGAHDEGFHTLAIANPAYRSLRSRPAVE